MKKVSVIIPAHNEEKTIEDVIKVVQNNSFNAEIIVVDNCCTDNTAKIAEENGAKVVKCEQHGKGYAMKKGLEYANGDIVVYLDADILDYIEGIVDKLVYPIVNEDVDFVKSTFDRETGGVVTNIVVKPLLDILFPSMYKFSEPISGMIATKKEILEKISFEKDYGVDIGILIDVVMLGYNVKEVNIGKMKNMSHTLKTVQSMSDMSSQIMRAILKRKK